MELAAEKRAKLGKQTKSLRTGGTIPAVIFGKKLESLPITLSVNQFNKVYSQAGETDLITIKTDSKTHKVLIKEVQVDPITGYTLHVGFYEPNLKEKITANIPVEVVGDETNVLVKGKQGIVLQLLDEITVRALPMDLPHAFIVDVSSIAEVGEGVLVEQLQYDREKVEIVFAEPDELVVKIDYAEMQEEAEEEVSEEEAVAKLEATAETAKEEEEGAGEGGEGKESSAKEKIEKKEDKKE